MSKVKKVLDDAMVPSGEFGEFQPEGDPPGSIQFTNHSSSPGRIRILGSMDGVNWATNRTIRVRAGGSKLRKIKLTPFLKFHNRDAAFGPATIEVESASE